MVEVIAAAAAGAQALFNYNRKNYMWDQELRIKREYQGQVRTFIDDLCELQVTTSCVAWETHF